MKNSAPPHPPSLLSVLLMSSRSGCVAFVHSRMLTWLVNTAACAIREETPPHFFLLSHIHTTYSMTMVPPCFLLLSPPTPSLRPWSRCSISTFQLQASNSNHLTRTTARSRVTPSIKALAMMPRLLLTLHCRLPPPLASQANPTYFKQRKMAISRWLRIT